MPDLDRLMDDRCEFEKECASTPGYFIVQDKKPVRLCGFHANVWNARGAHVSVLANLRETAKKDLEDALVRAHEAGAIEHTPARDNVLTQAEALIYGERAATYGPADENMGAIIRMFNAWLDIRYLDHTQAVDLDSFDAVMFNVCIKTCRLAHSLRKDPARPHMDSIVDGAGYFGLLGKIVEERAAKAAKARERA